MAPVASLALLSRSLLSSALAAAVLGLLAGCGGEDRGRVTHDVPKAPPLDQCEFASTFELGTTIVDFEPWEQNGRLTVSARCADTVCPSGPFYFNHDDNTVLNEGEMPTCRDGCSYCPSLAAASSNPDVGGVLDGSKIPDGPRCGTSTSALHFTASNIGACFDMRGRPGWGGSLEIKLLDLDASEYDGISFWVRKGESLTGASILLSVVDPDNQGVNEGEPGKDHCGCWPLEPGSTEAPLCSSDPDKSAQFKDFPDNLKCDPFGAGITLTDEWTFIPVYFSKLRQKGYGFPSSSSTVDKSDLTRLQFLINHGDWDFWLDDITFFKAPR